MIYEHRLRVRYAETDAMRVAHHAAYLVWLEEGRIEFLRALGFSFADVEASGYGQAVREVHLLYRRPARFDQQLALHIALLAASGPRLRFGFRFYDAAELDSASAVCSTIADGPPNRGGRDVAPIAAGTMELVWVTPEGRPTRLPRWHPLFPVLAAVERHPDWTEP